MDLLAAKIIDAYRHGGKRGFPEEEAITEVMIPIDEYTTLDGEQTVIEAIKKLEESFGSKVSISRIMETGHRSVLVLDDRGIVQGVLAIKDLLEALMPAYLSAPTPSMADRIQHSPMFLRGMFTRKVRGLAKEKVKEITSPAPFTIDGKSTLMEATYVMLNNKRRRLTVLRSGEVVGVIREQDLFFEMERIQQGMS